MKKVNLLMSIITATHINLRGQAREALLFYQAAFGGDIQLVTYKDAGNVQDPNDADNVMWGQVTSNNGFRVMAYDVPAAMPWHQGENAYFISVRSENVKETTFQWDCLASGGTVIQPLAPAQWTTLYGMVKDKFGVVWLLDVVTPS